MSTSGSSVHEEHCEAQVCDNPIVVHIVSRSSLYVASHVPWCHTVFGSGATINPVGNDFQPQF